MDFTDNHGVLPVESRKTLPMSTSLGSRDSSGTGTVRRDPVRRSAVPRWVKNQPPGHQLPATAVKPARSRTLKLRGASGIQPTADPIQAPRFRLAALCCSLF
ncbi:hypothetical protein CRENBAI_020883 [Crenichthys baileyi]|uniref:Uncharacterized protein n=1 Tax=Crenichthys baileyi TaxID=28760 RepID=A0AAV9S4B7_9TELE